MKPTKKELMDQIYNLTRSIEDLEALTVIGKIKDTNTGNGFFDEKKEGKDKSILKCLFGCK